MPLLHRPLPPPVPVVLSDPGRDHSTAVWVAPDGSQWPLTQPDLGWFTVDQVAGLGAAPVQHTTDPHPRGGVRVRHTQPQQRYITWPLYIEGRTHSEFVERWRALARAFTQTRRLGPGLLRITRPDGTAREIAAWYEAGFAEQPGQGWEYAIPVLTLLCEDPYWVDTTPTVVERQFGTTTNYYDPYASISSGQILGETTVENRGDVEAWPVWTVHGPMAAFTAVNHTTGEAFTLTGPLGQGQTATIVTDPPRVRGPAGENWVGRLDWPDAVLWGLVPGTNEVEFTVADADDGTRVELSFRQRWETP